MSEPSTSPRFVAYFAPVLDALRDLGGEARPRAVYDRLAARLDVPEAERREKTSGGQTRFENKVGWARFYLAHAGLIDGARRGVWALTDAGRAAQLDGPAALALFRDIHARFQKPEPDEDAAAPEPGAPASEVCWFVGAYWAGADPDQTPRFVEQGVWEYEEVAFELVKSMQPGDRIAIKSTYVRKLGLPFDNQERPVSVMGIKAVGVVTANDGDGRRVRVAWEPLAPLREWYFFTYRDTVRRLLPDRPGTVALIRFTFDHEPQDLDWWLSQPYWAGRYGRAPTDAAAGVVAEPIGEDVAADEPAPRLPEPSAELLPPYTIDDIVTDGCFLPREEIERAVRLLRRKKNLVLQGPPGTGKTWLARRLAYALIGCVDPDRVTAVQFQPSLSYEDFVRGWRPGPTGLSLVDGVFLQTVRRALARPHEAFVLVIEEINRGNPAQIFGELLTLLEADKREPREALRLAYATEDDERIHIPPNLHVVGTMNLADRSLALVDLALRRRFAFVTLKPEIGPAWRAWCRARGAPEGLADAIAARLGTLNAAVAGDKRLGEQFRVGHSFVTPPESLRGGEEAAWRAWFASVVDSEIGPLLDEYWYDDPEAAERERTRLLAGW